MSLVSQRTHDLNRVVKLRDALMEKCFGLPGLRADQELLADMVVSMLEVLPKGSSDFALWSTVRELAGLELTQEMLFELSWRVAGNVHLLKQGKPIRQWYGQPEPEWVPVQVLTADSRLMRAREKSSSSPVADVQPAMRRFYLYRMQVMAGSACPMVLDKGWSVQFVSTMVVRHIGFTAPWGKLPFASCLELVGLRFLVELDPERSRKKAWPDFERIRCPGSCLVWNKELLERRWREKEGYSCPMGWDVRAVPCYKCPKGYVSCPVACHPEDYLWGMCSSCGKEGWFDPADTSSEPAVCIDCGSSARKQW